jgi:hypothetical protein
MELNNKKDLISLLAESDFQGLGDDGVALAYSVFEDIDINNGRRIFMELHENLKEWLNKLGMKGYFEISALDIMKVGMRNIELNNTAEVLHFVWQCGITYQEIRLKLAALKKLDDEQKRSDKNSEQDHNYPGFEPEKEMSSTQVAVELDKEMAQVAKLVNQLPINRDWRHAPEWERDYQARLENIRKLITNLI